MKLCLVVGLAAVLFSGSQMLHWHQRIVGATFRDGRVTDFIVNEDSESGSTFSPIVEYLDGSSRVATFNPGVFVANPGMSVGDRVKVAILADRDYPDVLILRWGYTSLGGWFLLFILGILILLWSGVGDWIISLYSR
jgi:hypothetical protein